MACEDNISKSITSNCTTQGSGGNEVKGWIFKQDEIAYVQDVTNPSMLTAITLGTGLQAYTFTGVKKMLNSGSDIVIEEARADGFTHFVGFSGFEFKSVDVENFDSMDNLVFVVESKDKTDDGEGVFRVFGLKQGLVKSSDTMRANDNYGSRMIEMSTPPGQVESYSNYTLYVTSYAATLAVLVALETPQI